MLFDPPSPPATGRLRIAPATLAEANDLVSRWHRHHAPAQGYRFALLVVDGAGIVHGAAISGRPVSRRFDRRAVIEVTRVVTDGTKNACSLLYAASARVAREMGYRKIQTYIGADELGTSLRAAGWALEANDAGGPDWNCSTKYAGTRRTDQPKGKKQRWVKILAAEASGEAG